MNSTVRLGARGKFASAARQWPLFFVVTLLVLTLAFPIHAAKGGNGKGGGNGGGKGGGNGGAPGTGAVEEQHFLWRFPLAGPYSAVRPAVDANGTIYAVDVFDFLYAIGPDGRRKWFRTEAGSKGLDIGPDGTIYTGNENWIKAFRPDGSLKWTFVQSPRAFVLVDIAVGPDGNIYAVASSGMGVFSLRDNGGSATLRWTNPEPYGRPFTGYSEIAFGPTADGFGDQLYFHANGHTRAVRLSNGASIFTAGGTNQQPQVSPLDGTWHVGDAAYSPDGLLVWQFQYPAFTAAIQPAVGRSGTHYAVNQGRNLYAIGAEGVQRWTNTLEEYVGVPDVSPDEGQLFVPAGGGSRSPAALLSADAANGRPLWRTEFPAHPSGNEQFVDTGLAFNADGSMAYVVTAPAGGGAAYLNAIDTDRSIPSASTLLRSDSIAMRGRSKGRSVVITGVVTVLDENRGPVSGATVRATWTLPGGRLVEDSASTGSSGEAKFSFSGDGGLYWLSIDGITRTGYTFDPNHSVLRAGQYWF